MKNKKLFRKQINKKIIFKNDELIFKGFTKCKNDQLILKIFGVINKEKIQKPELKGKRKKYKPEIQKSEFSKIQKSELYKNQN